MLPCIVTFHLLSTLSQERGKEARFSWPDLQNHLL